MPLITVIVPVYRAQDYLGRCVESLIQQTVTDFELLLVDDGSPDQSPELCDAYAAQDRRIHVIHQPWQGLSAARNTGIEWALAYSDSKYLSFVDSDDWVHPKYLELLLKAVEDTGCCIVIGSHEKCNGSTELPDVPDKPAQAIDPVELYCTDPVTFIVTWGKLYPKCDFEDIRFPVGRIHEDEFTVWKILFRYDRAAYLDMPVYAYYQNPNGIICSPWTPARLDYLRALEEQREWIDVHSGDALKLRIRQRLALGYGQQITRMREAGEPKETVRLYRPVLKRYIRETCHTLPFRHYHRMYAAAWPCSSRVGWRAIQACHRIRMTLFPKDTDRQ